MRPKSFFLAMVCLMAPSVLLAEDPAVVQCRDLSESYRAKGADTLRHLEDHWMRMEWFYLKQGEVLYNALWQAEQKRTAKFSEELRAEGEVLTSRYRDLASTYLTLGEGERTSVARAVKKTRRLLAKISASCSAADFKTCCAGWHQNAEERLQDFERTAAKFQGLQDELRVRIARTGDETPSDHDDFGSRFFEPFGELAKVRGKLLAQMRLMQQDFDSNFTASQCCDACLRKNLPAEEDPVLSKVRLDPQGAKGVSGQVVNKAGLLQAFDELDEKKKKR